ncbi:MAG: hypothetical protein A3H28_04530 [Acidobacteria bacterium RIFCSPLOWO2_02_FULL_61_28]|nr:MAG: hypothetical protein A3H28_04530 [Acidobacteria bacterium RIFCSPLOWO2_02_FULL_61_28]
MVLQEDLDRLTPFLKSMGGAEAMLSRMVPGLVRSLEMPLSILTSGLCDGIVIIGDAGKKQVGTRADRERLPTASRPAS